MRRIKKSILCCRNVSLDSLKLNKATFYSVCFVYYSVLIPGRLYRVRNVSCYFWSKSHQGEHERLDLTPCGATRPNVVINCTACMHILRGRCVHVCVWLAWQPGLDVKHLFGDSFGCGCGVTPRHICRGADDPCPLVRPLLHHPNHFSDDCVISPLLSAAASSQKWHPALSPSRAGWRAADAQPWGDLEMANTMKLKNLGGKKAIPEKPSSVLFFFFCPGRVNMMLKIC